MKDSLRGKMSKTIFYLLLVIFTVLLLPALACNQSPAPPVTPAEEPYQPAQSTAPTSMPAEESVTPASTGDASPEEPAEPAPAAGAPSEEPIKTAPASDVPPEKTASPAPAVVVLPEEPALSDNLTRDCQLSEASAHSNFEDSGVGVGEMAINFTLRNIDGTEFKLSRFLAEKPVMMVFGAFT
jgi:hypothetical protein